MSVPFSDEQKQYLQGFMAGVLQRGDVTFVGSTSNGLLTNDPSQSTSVVSAAAEAKAVFGTPVEDLCREEMIKLDQNPLDIWEKMLAHAEAGDFPKDGDVFRWKFHGLFYVSPAQDSFMVRLRIPGCQLTSAQMRGLADMAENLAAGHADVTTRGNIQIREIGPRNTIAVLTGLADFGLTSRGSGADNVRNITASPTSGFDVQEIYDVRQLAKALHHYILNHRDLYGLPRKFNVSFDNGGAISVAGDTNDILFQAVRLKDKSGDVYFRVQLGGITGHKTIAEDCGLLLKPEDCVAVAVAMIRVFNENADRTDRKKARLKYLLEKWGFEKFLEETQKKLAFPLKRAAIEECEERPRVVKHAHVGVHPQREDGLRYVGVLLPIGRMTAPQMRVIADAAAELGRGELRLTVFQNVLIPHVPVEKVAALRSRLLDAGLSCEGSEVRSGLVACTGNKGCKYAATDTKGHALALGSYLEGRVSIDRPVNMHITGCHHSCAQHYVGDIGFIGAKVMQGEKSVEGYNIVLGGGMDQERGIAREVFTNIPFNAVPPLVERILGAWKRHSEPGESFVAFARRHQVDELRILTSEGVAS